MPKFIANNLYNNNGTTFINKIQLSQSSKLNLVFQLYSKPKSKAHEYKYERKVEKGLKFTVLKI